MELRSGAKPQKCPEGQKSDVQQVVIFCRSGSGSGSGCTIQMPTLCLFITTTPFDKATLRLDHFPGEGGFLGLQKEFVLKLRSGAATQHFGVSICYLPVYLRHVGRAVGPLSTHQTHSRSISRQIKYVSMPTFSLIFNHVPCVKHRTSHQSCGISYPLFPRCGLY